MVTERSDGGEQVPTYLGKLHSSQRTRDVYFWLPRTTARGSRRLALVGRMLAHYRITAAIGAGGMGEVYRATDSKLGRVVALKVLPPDVAMPFLL